jgi:hypothetical protein
MYEKTMLELADQFKELKDKKSEMQAALKDVQAQLDEVEAKLIEVMTTEECDGFKRGGSNFSLVVRSYPGAIPDMKEQLYDVMKKQGFEHLFTINPQTLSATVKEIKVNNDNILPDWLEGLIQIYEEPSIRVTKSK